MMSNTEVWEPFVNSIRYHLPKDDIKKCVLNVLTAARNYIDVPNIKVYKSEINICGKTAPCSVTLSKVIMASITTSFEYEVDVVHVRIHIHKEHLDMHVHTSHTYPGTDTDKAELFNERFKRTFYFGDNECEKWLLLLKLTQ